MKAANGMQTPFPTTSMYIYIERDRKIKSKAWKNDF